MRAIQGGTYGETKYYEHEHDGASGYRHFRFDYGIRNGMVRDSIPIVNVTPKSHELKKQIRFDISYLRMARVWAENSVAVRTLASLAKVGDTLRVRWIIGNSNSMLLERGLREDSAYVLVVRKDKIVGNVLVEQRVSPADRSSFIDRTHRFNRAAVAR